MRLKNYSFSKTWQGALFRLGTAMITLCLVFLMQTSSGMAAEKKQKSITFVKTLGKDAEAYSVAVKPDGGFIVTGGIQNRGVFVTSLDRNGKVIWEKYYGTPGYGREESMGEDIRPTRDGGYVLTGWKSTKMVPRGMRYVMMVQKIDARGNSLWEKAFPFEVDYSTGLTVQEMKNGGFIVCGRVPGSYEMSPDKKTITRWIRPGGAFVARLDNQGNTVWKKIFKAQFVHFYDERKQYQALEQGDHIYVAYTFGRPEGENGINYPNGIKVIKLNLDGKQVWEKEIRDDFGAGACLSGIAGTHDGGLTVVGFSNKVEVPQKGVHVMAFAARLDGDGNWLWKTVFGRISQNHSSGNRPQSIATAGDGSFIISGNTEAHPLKRGFSTGWIVKMDKNGMALWDRIYGREDRVPRLYAAQPAPDRGYVSTGYSTARSAPPYPVIIKTDDQGQVANFDITTDSSKLYSAKIK